MNNNKLGPLIIMIVFTTVFGSLIYLTTVPIKFIIWFLKEKAPFNEYMNPNPMVIQVYGAMALAMSFWFLSAIRNDPIGKFNVFNFKTYSSEIIKPMLFNGSNTFTQMTMVFSFFVIALAAVVFIKDILGKRIRDNL
jgi:hypothetical protein